MGMYTGIRFEGIVKKEFREQIEGLMQRDEIWSTLNDPKLKEFGKELGVMSLFIPFGSLFYMPDHWDYNSFNLYYNEETGYWTFKCSLKNYDNELEKFIDLVPYFIEKVFHFEYLYEEWEESRLYALKNNELVVIKEEVWER